MLLSDTDKNVVKILSDALQPSNEMFWEETYGEKETALGLDNNCDEADRALCLKLIEMEYGPWAILYGAILHGNKPFIPEVGIKPKGANVYPHDMTKSEFEAAVAVNPDLKSLYTLVRRDESGGLISVWYHDIFAGEIAIMTTKLREAADIALDSGLATYLRLRAKALETDEYRESDMAWMDMKKTQSI